MKFGKKYYIIATIVSAIGCACFSMLGYKGLSLLCFVMFITNVALCIKIYENDSPAYKHLKTIEKSGYARTYEGYTPNQFDGIYDWEKDDIENYMGIF